MSVPVSSFIKWGQLWHLSHRALEGLSVTLNPMCFIRSEHTSISPLNLLRIYGASFRRFKTSHSLLLGNLHWDTFLSWPLDHKASCPVGWVGSKDKLLFVASHMGSRKVCN